MDDRPHLRPVEAFPLEQDGKTLICLRDPERISSPLAISPATYFILSHFDGQHSLLDIQEAYCRGTGEIFSSEDLKEIIGFLGNQLYLYSARYFERQQQILDEFRQLTTRPGIHAGTVYKQDPAAFKAQIDRYFQPPQGPGQPKLDSNGRTPRAIVVPHIDFHRGGP